jgi:tetratricopeptide (TPR) repeat protein
MAHAGLDRDAIASCESAIRLSPRDPQLAVARASIGVAHYLAGRFTSAIEAANVALQLRPGTHGFQRLLCASLAQSDRLTEARHLLAELRREQPQLSIDWIRQNVPYQTPALMERFLDGMRKVGLRDAAWNTRR